MLWNGWVGWLGWWWWWFGGGGTRRHEDEFVQPAVGGAGFGDQHSQGALLPCQAQWGRYQGEVVGDLNPLQRPPLIHSLFCRQSPWFHQIALSCWTGSSVVKGQRCTFVLHLLASPFSKRCMGEEIGEGGGGGGARNLFDVGLAEWWEACQGRDIGAGVMHVMYMAHHWSAEGMNNPISKDLQKKSCRADTLSAQGLNRNRQQILH